MDQKLIEEAEVLFVQAYKNQTSANVDLLFKKCLEADDIETRTYTLYLGQSALYCINKDLILRSKGFLDFGRKSRDFFKEYIYNLEGIKVPNPMLVSGKQIKSEANAILDRLGISERRSLNGSKIN